MRPAPFQLPWGCKAIHGDLKVQNQLTLEQIETAIAIQSEMLAGLYRAAIDRGGLTPEEYREVLSALAGAREVSARLFAGPLSPLYQVAPLR